ncbi:hypothetical protein LMOSLCC7179_0343 [Listeria monocytogenes SLCC7179]|nr:hypothetical protein LMOSLCC7179_0343 [Listeria monocytogenes SLCC7179]
MSVGAILRAFFWMKMIDFVQINNQNNRKNELFA